MTTTFSESERYECLVDPADLYVIWDNLADTPCMVDSNMLAFPTRAKAVATLDLLNQAGAANACGDTCAIPVACGKLR